MTSSLSAYRCRRGLLLRWFVLLLVLVSPFLLLGPRLGLRRVHCLFGLLRSSGRRLLALLLQLLLQLVQQPQGKRLQPRGCLVNLAPLGVVVLRVPPYEVQVVLGRGRGREALSYSAMVLRMVESSPTLKSSSFLYCSSASLRLNEDRSRAQMCRAVLAPTAWWRNPSAS